MVSLLIKALIIILFGIASIIGVQQLQFEGTGTERIQHAINSTVERLPENVTDDVSELGRTFPWEDIKLFLWGGVRGIVDWISNALNILFGWILHLIKPDLVIPKWFGMVVFLTVLGILFWKGSGTIFDLLHTTGGIIIVVVFAILVVSLLLILLGAV